MSFFLQTSASVNVKKTTTLNTQQIVLWFNSYQGKAQLQSRAHDRQATAGREHTLAPTPGRLKGLWENDYFH